MPNTYRSTQLRLSHKSSILPANLIEILFAFLAAFVLCGSFLIHSTEGYLSITVKRLLCYGKYAKRDVHAIGRQYEVPKRWFAHFYVVAVIITSITLILAALRYFYDYELPHFTHFILDVMLGPARIPIVSPESTMTAIFLLHVQCWKRLYETYYVSVFSDAKMNLSHYAAGFIHYIGSAICIIGESYGFVQDSNGTFRWSQLESAHIISAIIFLMASYEQLKSNIILANLRKDEDGVVITKAYKIPNGRLFEYISAPLQFTEIIMYLMLTIILWEGSSFHYVFIWVVVNQFLNIDGVRIKTDNLADILSQKTMRKRCNHIMREMWSPGDMQNIFLKTQCDNATETLTTPADRRKLRNVCLHFQKRRKIEYGPGSRDDIDIYIKEWMSTVFRECRRKLKKNDHQAN